MLYYWLKVFSKLRKYKRPEVINIPEKPFSIVIAAKNEEDNIVSCIKSILTQKYSNFEIIVVNDHSVDKTFDLISLIQSEKVIIFNNLEENSGKKSAIEFGISKARHEHLVFIDADCMPVSDQWLSEINKCFYPSKNLVLGHGRYISSKGVLNKLIRYESLLNAIQYFSHALNGSPYMGVGRNMAYKKSLFSQSEGFKNHLSLKSGDDDLFVNENSSKLDVGIMTAHVAHSVSKSSDTFKEYIFQKRRHLQAGVKYKSSHKIMLAIYGASQFLFSAFFLVLLLYGFAPLIVLSVFFIKELIQVYIIKDICKELNDKDLIKWKPFLESLYIFIITAIGISTWIWKVDRWK